MAKGIQIARESNLLDAQPLGVHHFWLGIPPHLKKEIWGPRDMDKGRNGHPGISLHHPTFNKSQLHRECSELLGRSQSSMMGGLGYPGTYS
jgi:hypothetical protein